MNEVLKYLRFDWISKAYFFILIPALIVLNTFHNLPGGWYIPFGNYNLPASASASEFAERFIGNDAAIQVSWGLNFINNPNLDGYYSLDLWPPGTALTYMIVLYLSGVEFFPLKMVLLSAFLYGFSSYFLRNSFDIQSNIKEVIFNLIFLIPIFYDSFGGYFFSGYGSFTSDFYCFCFMSLMMASLIRNKGNIKNLILISFVFSFLIYSRSFYYLYYSLLVKLLIVAIILISFFLYLRDKKIYSLTKSIKLPFIRQSIIILSITGALILPWKLAYLYPNHRDFAWTATDQVWAAQWRNDYPSDTFLIGINTPCIVEKVLCEQLFSYQHADTWALPTLGAKFYKNLTIVTFLQNPIFWYKEKIKIFNYFWFDAHQLKLKSLNLSDVFSMFLLLSCFLIPLIALTNWIFYMLGKKSYFIGYNSIYVIYTLFCIHNLIVFTFVHYEARYSISLKWVTLLTLAYMLFNFFDKNKKT